MSEILTSLIEFINSCEKLHDKVALSDAVVRRFSLIKDRSVYYNKNFSIRFSSSNNEKFSNTVLSLSNLQKFDDKPFVVCLVTPNVKYLLLANSTFLKKISHSSHDFRENNIRGSFNGSDIIRDFQGIKNSPENFERLFDIHHGIGFDGNLVRLVEATNDISPSGQKFVVNNQARETILNAPDRAKKFVESPDAITLKSELDEKVAQFRNEILLAALIENINVRGRVIEYLIAGEDDQLRENLIETLHDKNKTLIPFKTGNDIGDYHRDFDKYKTKTDIKTKIMILNSNPKAYNIDKILEFLSSDKSVFMFYFIGIDLEKTLGTILVSMFQNNLLSSTVLLKHWAGRNSRGVTQFEGKAIGSLLRNPETCVNTDAAKAFLNKIIDI